MHFLTVLSPFDLIPYFDPDLLLTTIFFAELEPKLRRFSLVTDF